MTSTSTSTSIPAHNIFTFDDIIFSSNFDNGNLARVERIATRPYDFKIWTAPDNMGTDVQSKHCAWFHFVVSGLPLGCVIRIQIVNAANHGGLYKHDMRPVYKGNCTNNRWVRIKSSVRFSKEAGEAPQMFFEHGVEGKDDKLFFAFTYPYTYTMVQNELDAIDKAHINDFNVPDSMYYKRELVTRSGDGRRVDLLTISSMDGISSTEREPLIPGLFPESSSITSPRRPGSASQSSRNATVTLTSQAPHSSSQASSLSPRGSPRKSPMGSAASSLYNPQLEDNSRAWKFPDKEVVFISCRVHPGEVPAQHTFKGILSLLVDPDDIVAKALRARYVFKLIPLLNPDGVYRGHFRMDQYGQNLNRYYTDPHLDLQPSIYAAKAIVDQHAATGKLCIYLDYHAHASKRGCFIYGNVLDSAEDQIQNQLFCRLVAMNTAHFDYEACLFSKDHMTRIDPGDQAKGLTAEGSGRVSTYLRHGLVHSYTIECNYNTSRVGNEIAPTEVESGGSPHNITPVSSFTTMPDKYTPSIYMGVGRACIVAILDIREQNPCSRISRSKLKTLDRVRNMVMMEVRSRKEYVGSSVKRRTRGGDGGGGSSSSSSSKRNSLAGGGGGVNMFADSTPWKRLVDGFGVEKGGYDSGADDGTSQKAWGSSNNSVASSSKESSTKSNGSSRSTIRRSSGGSTPTAATAPAVETTAGLPAPVTQQTKPGVAMYVPMAGGSKARRRSRTGIPAPINRASGGGEGGENENIITAAAAAAAAAPVGVRSPPSGGASYSSVSRSPTNMGRQSSSSKLLGFFNGVHRGSGGHGSGTLPSVVTTESVTVVGAAAAANGGGGGGGDDCGFDDQLLPDGDLYASTKSGGRGGGGVFTPTTPTGPAQSTGTGFHRDPTTAVATTGLFAIPDNAATNANTNSALPVRLHLQRPTLSNNSNGNNSNNSKGNNSNNSNSSSNITHTNLVERTSSDSDGDLHVSISALSLQGSSNNNNNNNKNKNSNTYSYNSENIGNNSGHAAGSGHAAAVAAAAVAAASAQGQSGQFLTSRSEKQGSYGNLLLAVGQEDSNSSGVRINGGSSNSPQGRRPNSAGILNPSRSKSSLASGIAAATAAAASAAAAAPPTLKVSPRLAAAGAGAAGTGSSAARVVRPVSGNSTDLRRKSSSGIGSDMLVAAEPVSILTRRTPSGSSSGGGGGSGSSVSIGDNNRRNSHSSIGTGGGGVGVGVGVGGEDGSSSGSSKRKALSGKSLHTAGAAVLSSRAAVASTGSPKRQSSSKIASV